MESSKPNPAISRRILVVEDERFTSSLIVELLGQNGFVVKSVASAVEAKRAVASFDPDALIVDIELGGGPTGLELISALNRSNPDLSFVILSNFRPTASEIAALERTSYLSKREASDVESLVAAIESVLRDSNPKSELASTGELGKLTRSQLAVLRLIAQGLNNAEIAKRRNCSQRAVEQLVARIYEALGIVGDGRSTLRVQATRIYAREAGLPSDRPIR